MPRRRKEVEDEVEEETPKEKPPTKEEMLKQAGIFANFLNKLATQDKAEETYFDISDTERVTLEKISGDQHLTQLSRSIILDLLSRKKTWISKWELIPRLLDNKPKYDAQITISAYSKIGLASDLLKICLTDGKIDGII